MSIKYDIHLHTDFSPDSKTPMSDQVERAIELGLEGICFTDHMDYKFPTDQCEGFFENVFDLDIDSYKESIISVRNKYPEIKILTGIECGMQTDPEVIDFNYSISDDPDYDFIIGSMHLIDEKDPYYPAFWENVDPLERIKRYFELTLENINKYKGFDTLGHLDYIVRYRPSDAIYDPNDYMSIIDEILLFLIKNNKSLEVNTSALKKGCGPINPHPDIIKRYYDLGGRMITIGSDAHSPDAMAYGFDETHKILTDIGFKEYLVYEKRSPIAMPL